MTRRVLAAMAMMMVGCGSDGDSSGTERGDQTWPDAETYRDPAAVEARLQATLADLAAMGQKQPNTPGGPEAAEYLRDRMEAAGLVQIETHRFTLPGWSLASSSLTFDIDGAASRPAHSVLAYSPAAELDGLEVVDGGKGREADLEGLDVTGKVVLVERDSLLHRSTQYQVVQAAGAAAMCYVGTAPDNQIQVGAIAYFYTDSPGIPALSIGADDGARIRDALADGRPVTVDASIDAAVAAAEGQNVSGWMPGSDPDGPYILVGAHYDTWMTGSVDNGTSVATLLEIAEAYAQRGPRSIGLRFVGFDAEEPGLFGSYAFLRDEVLVPDAPVIAFANLESPAGDGRGLCSIGHSRDAPFEDIFSAVGSATHFPLIAGVETATAVSGGVISTDMQGFYRTGVPTFMTVCTHEQYHTAADVPEIVRTDQLAAATLHLQEVFDALDATSLEDWDTRDANLWRAEVRTSGAQDLVVEVDVTDHAGAPQGEARVEVILLVDDFDRAFRQEVTANGAGRATVTIPAAAVARGSGDRWLHVNAGERFPLVEVIQPLEP